MTEVNLDAYLRTLGGREPLTEGELRVDYVAGRDGYLDVDGAEVTFPSQVRVPFRDLSAPLTLEPTGGVCAVRLQLRAAGYLYEWWFEIPDVAEIDFGDLVESHQVDPASFAPVDDAATVLGTVRSELLDGLRLERISQAAYDLLPTPRPDDVLYVITP